LESHKVDINLSAETEQLFKTLLNKLENQAWVKRNANALVAHGEAIAKTGLAGQEFERI
jgi:antitoxin CcdA